MPGPAVDECGADPVLAQLLGPLGEQVGAGGAQLGARLLGEPGQALGGSRGGLEVVAQTARRGHLGVDIHFGGDGGVGARRRARRNASVARVSVASPWWVPAT